MTEKRRKLLYLAFKISAILISCGLPIYAVSEHFPLWKESFGTSRTVGAGGIICLLIVVTVFRRTVFRFLRDKFNLEHAPPLAVWLVLLAVSYVLVYINGFIRALTTVLWFGLVGCAIGMALTFVAENYFGERK